MLTWNWNEHHQKKHETEKKNKAIHTPIYLHDVFTRSMRTCLNKKNSLQLSILLKDFMWPWRHTEEHKNLPNDRKLLWGSRIALDQQSLISTHTKILPFFKTKTLCGGMQVHYVNLIQLQSSKRPKHSRWFYLFLICLDTLNTKWVIDNKKHWPVLPDAPP